MTTEIEKTEKRLGASIGETKDGIKEVAKRLQTWEDKGFKLAKAFFQDGYFVSLEGGVLSLEVKEEEATNTLAFIVSANTKIHIAGKDGC